MPLVAKYRLECDGVGCGIVEPLGDYESKSQITSEMMKRGWQMQKGNKVLCPKCIKKKVAVKPD